MPAKQYLGIHGWDAGVARCADLLQIIIGQNRPITAAFILTGVIPGPGILLQFSDISIF